MKSSAWSLSGGVVCLSRSNSDTVLTYEKKACLALARDEGGRFPGVRRFVWCVGFRVWICHRLRCKCRCPRGEPGPCREIVFLPGPGLHADGILPWSVPSHLQIRL